MNELEGEHCTDRERSSVSPLLRHRRGTLAIRSCGPSQAPTAEPWGKTRVTPPAPLYHPHNRECHPASPGSMSLTRIAAAYPKSFSRIP